MSRIVALGVTALMLAACGPAEQSAAPPEAAAPVATASNPASAAVIWEATQDRYRQIEVAPSDPVEALEWRAVLCSHMAGEFGGDNSERDQSLTARMDELRCGDALLAEVRTLRAARAADAPVIARLDTLLTNLQP